MAEEKRGWQLGLALVFYLVAAVLILAAKDVCSEYLPPEPELVIALGCNIQEYEAPDKWRWWHVYVWAKDYRERRWQRLFAVREITKRPKAMQDCEKWLRCAERRIADAKRRRKSRN